MKTVEVNFTTILECLNTLNTKLTENNTIAEQLRTIINGVDSSWEDLYKNSSTIYKEKSLKYVGEMENNIKTIQTLMAEISKAMTEYSDNENKSNVTVQNVQF
jgi:DNA-binding ferritin-like protein